MRNSLAVLFLVVLGAVFLIGCDVQQEPLIIENITIISGENMQPRPNFTILVRENMIKQVYGPERAGEIPTGRVIDGSGLYAIPGLWDVHVHLSKIKEEALPVFVANGVTSVRDMGSDFQEVQRMKGRIRMDEIQGPTIITPGPLLEAPETLDRIKGQKTQEDFKKQRIAISDSLSAFPVVDSLKHMEVDFIKVREYASVSAYKGIAEAARQAGMDFVGHPPYAMDPVEAARTLDMKTWEHASYPYPLPEGDELRELLEAIRDNGIAMVPTLATWRLYVTHPDSVRKFLSDTLGKYDPRRRLISDYHAREMSLELEGQNPKSPQNLAGWKQFIRQTAMDMKTFHDAGIHILAGSDQSSSVLVPGYSLHKELEHMQDMIGMKPEEILRRATYTASRVFGMEDSLGTIEEGKIANMVLLSRNPLEDIANTRHIVYVINKGELLDEAQITRMLKGLTPRTRSGIDYIQK